MLDFENINIDSEMCYLKLTHESFISVDEMSELTKDSEIPCIILLQRPFI